MGKYEPNDKFYTILGVFVVFVGVAVFLFNSSFFNDIKLNNKENELDNDNIVDINNNQDEVIDNSISNSTENSDSVNSPSTQQPENNVLETKDIMTCTQNKEESGLKTESICEFEFKNGYLALGSCISTTSSDDEEVLKQQYSISQFTVTMSHSSIKDKSVVNIELNYENNKKYTLKTFTDYIKLEQNPNAVTEAFSSDLSSKNTKEEVKKIISEEKYVCK